MTTLSRTFQSSSTKEPYLRTNTYNRDIQLVFAAVGSIQQGGVPVVITSWSVSTRPASPEIGKTFGYNTDYDGLEFYTSFGWRIVFGTWTTANRPSGVAAGSEGWNTTLPAKEYWTGRRWQQQ